MALETRITSYKRFKLVFLHILCTEHEVHIKSIQNCLCLRYHRNIYINLKYHSLILYEIHYYSNVHFDFATTRLFGQLCGIWQRVVEISYSTSHLLSITPRSVSINEGRITPKFMPKR